MKNLVDRIRSFKPVEVAGAPVIALSQAEVKKLCDAIELLLKGASGDHGKCRYYAVEYCEDCGVFPISDAVDNVKELLKVSE